MAELEKDLSQHNTMTVDFQHPGLMPFALRREGSFFGKHNIKKVFSIKSAPITAVQMVIGIDKIIHDESLSHTP